MNWTVINFFSVLLFWLGFVSLGFVPGASAQKKQNQKKQNQEAQTGEFQTGNSSAQVSSQTSNQPVGQANGQANGQAAGQTDRQNPKSQKQQMPATDSHTDSQADSQAVGRNDRAVKKAANPPKKKSRRVPKNTEIISRQELLNSEVIQLITKLKQTSQDCLKMAGLTEGIELQKNISPELPTTISAINKFGIDSQGGTSSADGQLDGDLSRRESANNRFDSKVYRGCVAMTRSQAKNYFVKLHNEIKGSSDLKLADKFVRQLDVFFYKENSK